MLDDIPGRYFEMVIGETLEFDAHPSGGWVERVVPKPSEEDVPF